MQLNRLKQRYINRILNAKPAELVVINLELALDFIKQEDLARARKAICQLAEALDFRYDLSKNLYGIYSVIEKKITAGIANNNIPAVNDAEYLIRLLINDWKNTVKSAAGTQEMNNDKPNVYIGLTYDANGLCEYASHTAGFKA